MMNRILKRPMFRMGGRSDDGIMSLRPKYQEGGDVGIFTRIMDAINPPSGKVLKRMQDVQNAPSLGERLFSPSTAPLEFRTQAEASEFLEANPENIRPIKILGTGETINLMGSAEASETDQTVKPEITTTTDTDTKTQELSDNDLKTMYEDLLPLFKSELSADEDELKRQKYLELAKFGANILAQPGGDLVGSIGRAAAPSIEGLTRVAETKRRANQSAKAMALEAALKQMDPGQLRKNYKDLISLGYTPEEAKKYLVEQGSGTREATKQSIIERRAKSFYNDGITKTETGGERAAETISKFNIDLSSVSKLPESQDDLDVGQYYIKDDGSVRRFDGEKLLTPSDEGFK
jgi:hypothetical protein